MPQLLFGLCDLGLSRQSAQHRVPQRKHGAGLVFAREALDLFAHRPAKIRHRRPGRDGCVLVDRHGLNREPSQKLQHPIAEGAARARNEQTVAVENRPRQPHCGGREVERYALQGFLAEPTSGAPRRPNCRLPAIGRSVAELEALASGAERFGSSAAGWSANPATQRLAAAQLIWRRLRSCGDRAGFRYGEVDTRAARSLLKGTAMAERTTTVSSTERSAWGGTAELCHDLRAPLQAISGFATLLREEKAQSLDEEGLDFVERIAAAMERLIDVVEAHRGIGVWRQAGSPVEVVSSALALRRASAQIADLSRGSGGRIVIAGEWPQVLGHEGALAQMLANLISNALKHGSAEGGIRVEVEGQIDGAQLRIVVSDDGLGIAANELAWVRDILAGRVGRGSARGLVIAAELANAMGARIRPISSLLGGAAFEVILDLPQAAECIERPSRSRAAAPRRVFERGSGLGRAGLRSAGHSLDPRGLQREV